MTPFKNLWSRCSQELTSCVNLGVGCTQLLQGGVQLDSEPIGKEPKQWQ